MMKRIACSAALALLTSLASAQTFTAGTLSISQPWARATTPTVPTGAIYLSVTNQGQTPDRLLSARSTIAKQTEIHSSTMDNGMMRMRPVTDGVPIAPGSTVAFAPGGLHIMLVGLKHPLKTGEHFKLVLHFEKAGDHTVSAVVRDTAAPAGGMDMNMKMN